MIFTDDHVNSVEEGVKKLLTIAKHPIPNFKLIKKGNGDFIDSLFLDGEKIPLSYHVYEPRIDYMREYAATAVADICCVNTYSYTGSDVSLDELIYRELDISEHVLLSKIHKITAYINDGACNLIAKTQSGALANLELGNTMAPDTIPQFSHRLITKSGMASDRTVNTMVEQSGVYLFSSQDSRPTTYDDGDHYLYGLSCEESNEAVYIYAIISGILSKKELIERDIHIRALLSSVKESAKCGKSIYVDLEEIR